ncbi:MAG TPA: energy transducer TonB [Rhodanobacteraceae bacterium]
MTSLAINRPFEYTPHAMRSFAMALAMSFNLALVLLALLPSTPPMHYATPRLSLLATILQPPPPVVPPPAVPTLHVVKHVAAPIVHVTAPHPATVKLPALATVAPITPITPVSTAATSNMPNTAAAVGSSEATIAYETATPPAYPIQALRDGIEGTVLLKVLVDTNGKPVRVMVMHSSGSRALDNAARQHVLAAWRFHPAIRDGIAIEAWAVVPVQFNLNNG